MKVRIGRMSGWKDAFEPSAWIAVGVSLFHEGIMPTTLSSVPSQTG